MNFSIKLLKVYLYRRRRACWIRNILQLPLQTFNKGKHFRFCLPRRIFKKDVVSLIKFDEHFPVL